jgi:hypothetical protein
MGKREKKRICTSPQMAIGGAKPVAVSQNWCNTTHDTTGGAAFFVRKNTAYATLFCPPCRRFETGGSLSRRVSVSRAPAQMGRARGRARRGESEVAGDGRERGGNPAACSRGLQASTRVREASGPKRAPVPSSSRAANLL